MWWLPFLQHFLNYLYILCRWLRRASSCNGPLLITFKFIASILCSQVLILFLNHHSIRFFLGFNKLFLIDNLIILDIVENIDFWLYFISLFGKLLDLLFFMCAVEVDLACVRSYMDTLRQLCLLLFNNSWLWLVSFQRPRVRVRRNCLVFFGILLQLFLFLRNTVNIISLQDLSYLILLLFRIWESIYFSTSLGVKDIGWSKLQIDWAEILIRFLVVGLYV